VILNLFRKNSAAEPVFAVYGAIVAQSRQPRFYADWGVPDTVTGRFDMISLHLALLFRRLRASEEGRAFSQALFDLFFKDMDSSLREMGAGDLAVPKKIQKMTSLFYGMAASLDEGLDTGDPELLVTPLSRNIYEGRDEPRAIDLARYLIGECDRLAAQHVNTIVAGAIALGEAA
jgi:cytochrome b pre-mRNA-processing protein 3